AAKLEKASGEPGREIVGVVTMKQVREIAENLLHPSNEPMQRQPAGFARSSR
ncbi:MAG TPA: 50S ribosomal protein L11, partial [Gammaproteobacteria bacterium]|nr:50S ribosomal protein L11 [Gammaproteobacteria bacterium]